MPNYMPDSINSTVESATLKTQKMVDDFKKTDTGKKVSRSTSAALGSVYSFVDSLLSRGEELVDRLLPEPQSSAEVSTASPHSSHDADGVSSFSRALSLGSTVCSRVHARATKKVYAFGSNVSVSYEKAYANVVDYFETYLRSFQTILSYVKDTFPALQIAEEDFLAIRNKATEWWAAFVERVQKVFYENKEAAQTSMKKGEDAVHQYTTQAKETAAKYSADVKERATKARETATMYATDAKDTASKYVAGAREAAEKYAADAKDTASKYAVDAKETAGKYAADAKATADKYYQTATDKVNATSK
ncbi:conserved hypothetical protein [Perkinsus marinus ATCC 50983]|uniref:Uncharacterized protein n=1 Tax=Perkinsus marinus (strain ATCC 50983 / TXsc) TaxID=423536 RepID=C5L6X8_PERM5|nr:conserved hypothetical protein [Perkinsus marinus ATCC 50983]EER07240.1 conserved hypothetical protein [Perkinsus marinus ATCC 50983]|eukprot:XP_002775424.1 conserved hypothetical protein [Perkinsus marinus ATCC 50983]